MPNHKGPRGVTAVLLGTVPAIYSCSIPISWMDGWMDGQDQGESSWTILLATTRGQCPTTNYPPLAGLADRGPGSPLPPKDSRAKGGPRRRGPTWAALGAAGQEEAAGAGPARTQHADAQHEGVHSVGHDSRPAPGRAGRRHHLFWLRFLTFHLQRDLASVLPPALPFPGLFTVHFRHHTLGTVQTGCLQATVPERSHQPHHGGAAVTPILQMMKWRLRERKPSAQ